jgi:RNA polymerase sigma factor for flagellar operon FliA
MDYKKEKDEKTKQELRNKIIELYLPLVEKIAYKLSEKIKWRILPDELTSFGIDGLIIAIEKFELNKGVNFATYSSIRIRGSMLDNIRKQDIIPRSVRINYNKFEEIKNKLESKKGKKVSDKEIIKDMKIKEKDYLKNIHKFHPVAFSSIEISNINNFNNDEFKQDCNINLIDKKTVSPEDNLIRKEFLNKLISKNFTKLEQNVIFLYYYQNLTMKQISKNLCISESRVSQIHKMVLPRLKDKIKRNPNYFKKDIYKFILSTKK